MDRGRRRKPGPAPTGAEAGARRAWRDVAARVIREPRDDIRCPGATLHRADPTHPFSLPPKENPGFGFGF